MPKTKRKDEDQEFKPGKSRKSVFYDPKVDDRSVRSSKTLNVGCLSLNN